MVEFQVKLIKNTDSCMLTKPKISDLSIIPMILKLLIIPVIEILASKIT